MAGVAEEIGHPVGGKWPPSPGPTNVGEPYVDPIEEGLAKGLTAQRIQQDPRDTRNTDGPPGARC